MGLYDELKTKRTEAMKAHDEVSLRTLRAVLAACTNANVAAGKKPDTPLDDEAVLSVISSEAKKRREAIEQFEKGGRADLANTEKEELAILEEFLPEQMSEEDIQAVVTQKAQELGVKDKKDMGKLMGSLMKDMRGKADGNIVKQIVEQMLNE